MRRLTVALLAIVILGLSTTAWARGGGRKRADNPATPPAPAPVDLKGTLVKAEGNEITVTLKLPVDAVTTSVMIDGIGKTLADLKPGQSVTITLTNGKTTRIDATAPAAEAAKEPPKEAAKEAPKEPPKAPEPPK